MSAASLEGFAGLRHEILPPAKLDATLLDLVRAREEGDRRRFERLRDVIVSTSVRFVLDVVRRWRGRGLELEDLLQWGLLGFCRAIEGWDPNGGASLWTYARTSIRNVVWRAIDELSTLVRRPAPVHAAARKIARARGEYRDLHGREPTVEELAELVALPVAAVERCLALGPGVALSLDAPIEDTEGEGDTPLDMLADEDAPSPEDEALRREREGWTRELLDPALLEDVGRRFDMSRERARQIEGDALERMAKRARRAEQKRPPSTNRATLRLVPSPPVEAPPSSRPRDLHRRAHRGSGPRSRGTRRHSRQCARAPVSRR
ncbi:MAG: sigma-70 domain-containing protein [Polyangiaceae bacterium]